MSNGMAVLVHPDSSQQFPPQGDFKQEDLLAPMGRSNHVPTCWPPAFQSHFFSKFLSTRKSLPANGSPCTEEDHQVKQAVLVEGVCSSPSFGAGPVGSARPLARSDTAYTFTVKRPFTGLNSVN